ncbi:hypothetical protein BCR34DRAFT_145102 [Clohesyomyces aquaticus]|uniref:DUF7029 domain-containing protein n=1 Tax=Clohesyomyces aquaticus TaxID=1231657 RepID=A0A1Y2A0P0_9PLEO|nr:hypothetical protein BCR34DRAFT_145102 [Clohesyomyces aquaticus]
MGFFDFRNVCILLLAGSLSTQVSAKYVPPSPQDRVLRAATKRSDLFRRSMRIEQNFKTELSYIETENGWGSSSIFASSVRVNSKAPIFNLEEHEHHLQDVRCEGHIMRLDFVDPVSTRDARHACHGESGGFIITSHESCNEDGERAVYKVMEIESSADESSLELLVIKTAWKDAFSDLDIDFGYTTDGHLFRRHSDFQKIRRRQDSSSTTPVTLNTTATGTASVIAATPVSFTVSTLTSRPPIPTGIPDNKESATFDLAFQSLNTTFKPEDFLNGVETIVNVPTVPLEVGCKNCTTTGSLVLVQGNFKVGTANIPFSISDLDELNGLAMKAFESGFVELQANGLTAHIELFSKPSASGQFEMTLFKLPIVGFVIPGMGQAGVTFAATIQTSYNVTGGIEATYGFDLWVSPTTKSPDTSAYNDVKIPTTSKVKIPFPDLGNASKVGFDAAQVSALPFTANTSDIDLTLGVGFRPIVTIGFVLSDAQLDAEVDIFMDLPSLTAKFSSHKDGFDAECNLLSGNNSTSNSTDSQSPHWTNSTSPSLISNSTFLPSSAIPSLISEMGPLVLIEASVNVAIGVGGAFQVPIIAGGIPFETSVNVYETNFPLPTACLAANSGFRPALGLLQEKESSYIASVSSVSSVSSASSASAASSASQAAEASRTASAGGAGGNGNVPNPTSPGGGGQAKQSDAPGNSGMGRLANRYEGWQLAVLALGVVAGGMIML